MKKHGFILASGIGSRMGITKLPKQFLKLGDKPIVIHTIETFVISSLFDTVVVLTNADWVDYTKDILKEYNLSEKVEVTTGGVDRNSTIMNGIKLIEEKFGVATKDIIVTHDAVRPFVTVKMLEDNIQKLSNGDFLSCDTVVPAFDTIIKSNNHNYISEIPQRDYLYQGQTPQSFNINKLKELFYSLDEKEKEILTDACKIFVIKGEKVGLVEGSTFNMKITTQNDLLLANKIIEVQNDSSKN